MQFLGLVGKLLGSNVAFGTIHLLRQQKDWVGGFKKCQFLLTFSAVPMLKERFDGSEVGPKKSENMLT